jgi:hypothetical protein
MRELCSFGSGLETVETRADLISRMVELLQRFGFWSVSSRL